MSSNHSTASLITSRSFPSEGAKALQIVFDFSAAVVIYGDFQRELEGGILDFIQSVKIDNSQNASPLSIQFLPGMGTVGDTVICPAFSVLHSPIYNQAQDTPRYIVASAGAVKVPVTFLNIEVPYFTYSTAPVKSSVITSGTVANDSLVMTGASVPAFAANANALRRVIQAPTANNNSLFINFGTPATQDFHSQELAPGQSYDTGSGPIYTGAINIIGANGDNATIMEFTT